MRAKTSHNVPEKKKIETFTFGWFKYEERLLWKKFNFLLLKNLLNDERKRFYLCFVLQWYSCSHYCMHCDVVSKQNKKGDFTLKQ